MKEDKLYRSLEYVRDEYLEDAADAIQQGRAINRFRKTKVWLIAAACLTLVAIMFMMPLSQRNDPHTTTPSTHKNEPNEIKLTASDLAALFYAQTEGVGTKNYLKVTISDSDSFSIPDDEFLIVYQYDPTGIPLNESELKNFSIDRMNRFATLLGMSQPEYKIIEPSFINMYTMTNLTNNYLESEQYSYCNRINYNQSELGRDVVIDGKTISIDPTKSDEEILEIFDAVKEKLFSTFDVSFKDAKIDRMYFEGEEKVIAYFRIIYYNRNDHPLNDLYIYPCSDYIAITVDNETRRLHDDPWKTTGILKNLEFRYYQNRVSVNELYKSVGSFKTLPLEKAEEYLSKGYVFGGYHGCPLCEQEEMESKPLVDFTDYDYVDLQYVTGNGGPNDIKNIIPFYAFYKYIGDNDNGEALYAKTYVPAIEVEGIVEYFSHQS
jgi:hypothetical protein